MRISFNQACTLYNSDLKTDLFLCGAAGFDAIEIRIDKVREYLKKYTKEELKRDVQKSGLNIYAMNGIYVYKDFAGDKDDPQKAEQLLQDIRFECEIAELLGCDRMVMVPPVFREEENRDYSDPWEKALADNIRIFQFLADFVAPYKMKIGIEIVGAPRSSVRTVSQCNEIIRGAGRRNLGYTIDAYNLYLYHKTNRFQSILEADPARIFIVHINGGEKSPDGEYLQKYRTTVDRGIMDVKDFLENLRRVGYNDCVSIEFFRPEFWKMKPKEAINICYCTTKDFLNKMELYND